MSRWTVAFDVPGTPPVSSTTCLRGGGVSPRPRGAKRDAERAAEANQPPPF